MTILYYTVAGLLAFSWLISLVAVFYFGQVCAARKAAAKWDGYLSLLTNVFNNWRNGKNGTSELYESAWPRNGGPA